MPSFLTTPSIQWTKEQLQVRLNTNFQYEAIMLTICLKGKGTVFKGPKIPNSSEKRITWKEWIHIGGTSGKLTSEWTALMAQKISEVNPYCSVAFKKGWVRKCHSRKLQAPLFRFVTLLLLRYNCI